MNKIAVYFFLIAIGLTLIIFCLLTWNTKEGELFGGVLILYSGTIVLIDSIPKKGTTMYGLRFRGILVGIMGVIVGLSLIFSHFT